MAILRPTWQDIITEHNVQTWQDWPWDTWLGPYVVISPRRYRVRVRVYRAGEWVDITSRVASGVIRESNDQPVATLELRLLNGRQYPSLAPRRKDSPLNKVNGQYVPLLWIGRLIAVEAALSEDGSEPDEWWPVFLGELEDEIDTESGPDGTYVRLFCRDMAARLQRDYIAGPLTYENMFASQMIQQILNDRYAAGALPEPVTLRVVGQDDFFVERYDIEYTDLWSALQRFCQQRGTDLRYRLNEATGQIELTYWLPDRAMVPGWIIDGAQIRREELRISGTDIINRVTVRYRDAATGQRAEVTVQDADSIAMYGLRHGLIEEPDTDLIPDEETARKLAQAVVDDLKDVPALTRLTVPFDPRVQVFDKLRVANPAVRDEAEDYAIEGRELSFSATDWSMALVGGGRVVVKRQAWLERLAKEGVKQPFTPGDWMTNSRPSAPVVTLSTGLYDVSQMTMAYVRASWTRPNWRYIDRYLVRIRRIGTDTYQYQETTERAVTFHSLIPNVQYGVQVAVVDGRGVLGDWSTEQTITTPADTTVPAAPAAPTVTPAIRGIIVEVTTPNTEPDLAGYEIHVSTMSGFTPGTGTLKATLAATPGQKARLDVVDLTPGTTYYVKLKAFDTSGNVSAASAQVSAVAGYHHIHDSDAVRNVLSYTYADSLDESHKLDCVFYMPPETLKVRSAKVYVKGQPYRAYSLQAALVDIFGTETTAVGVPHSHGIMTATGTTSSDGRHSHTYSRANGTTSSGSHGHTLQYSTQRTGTVYELGTGVPDHTHQYAYTSGMYSAGAHTHGVTTTNDSTSSDGAHTHTYTLVTGVQSVSEFETRHSHQVNLSHSHPMVYGIFEEHTPTDVTVEVSDDDGATWKTVRTGLTDPVEATIDITDYLSTTEGYKHVRFSSSRRGRIAAMVLLDLHIDNV